MQLKKQHLLFAALIALLFFCCNTSKKVTYNIPDDYPPARREQIITVFNKGKEIYKTNCSECHGIFTKGNDKTPNFSYIQLDNYSARFLRGDAQNHAIARKMSQEQLGEVLTFLRYKKTKYKDTLVTAPRPQVPNN